ncbi:hypothetical protein GJ744_011801 [Endocarpon pusillum]|uniref:MARVEL domain-containing protein n=1 Tax=Endocarpon pusillum TaxID=364733 RepID=A0A8H7AEQ1_9EURO|nr:hypothetical protein GJ744_011801 [Endocarpon pusillum]
MDDTSPQQSNKKPWPEIAVHASLRFLQFVLGATVTALYGKSLVSPSKPAQYDRTKWTYAVAVACMSLLTAVACMMPYVRRFITWPWDLLLFILWIVVLGIFAGLCLDNGPRKDGSTRKVKSAAFFDLANMLLWFITGLLGAALHCLGPRLNR